MNGNHGHITHEDAGRDEEWKKYMTEIGLGSLTQPQTITGEHMSLISQFHVALKCRCWKADCEKCGPIVEEVR